MWSFIENAVSHPSADVGACWQFLQESSDAQSSTFITSVCVSAEERNSLAHLRSLNTLIAALLQRHDMIQTCEIFCRVTQKDEQHHISSTEGSSSVSLDFKLTAKLIKWLHVTHLCSKSSPVTAVRHHNNQMQNKVQIHRAAPLPGMNQSSITPPPSCSQTQRAPLCFSPPQIYSFEDGFDQHAGADRPRPLQRHMLLRSELKLVSALRKLHFLTAVVSERWNGAERSSAGPRRCFMFHLFGSTEGSGDNILWTQLLHELYSKPLGCRGWEENLQLPSV